MTPQEKAQELVDKFTFEIGNFNAKQSASIAVNEMLKVAYFISDNEIYNFLLEVKEELEKL